MKTLVIGVGNAGRGDDGLGPALIERLAGSRPPERAIVQTSDGAADVFWAYQLNIEDAAAVRDYDRVIFVDAAVDAPEPASLSPVEPAAAIAFTTHEMSPASVLALGEELYGRTAKGFLLSIRGLTWKFVERISAAAERNLAEAGRILGEFLKNT
ncbi:MAG: hydrogenase maturation protease [Candidatus Aminicenantales bacterium]